MGFSCSMVELVTDCDKINLETIKEVCSRSCVEKWLYIVHDKEETRPHYHVYLKFTENNTQKSKYIAAWFGVQENFLCKIRGRFSDAVKYAIHANRPEKHQYDKKEVVSNFDIQPYLDVVKPDNSEYDVYIQKILNGEIREFNQGLLPDAMYLDPIWNGKIKKAFEKRALNVRNERIQRGDGFMVIYIQGPSGSGKSTWAREYAKKQGMSVFVSGSSNDPLDGYAMQDAVVLDDLRFDTFNPADLYKIIDTTNVSSVKSRYKNKDLSECKVIFITCVFPWTDWYSKMADEPKAQFERRISFVVELDEHGNNMRIAGNENNKIQVFTPWVINPFAPSVIYKDRVQVSVGSILNSLGISLDAQQIRQAK